MEGQKCVTLSDNRQILLEDENDIVLSVVSGGETKVRLPAAYPSAGYGGGALSLSASEGYLLFSYCSGQSEEAFIVFRIAGDDLEPVYESGYLFGEGAGYLFSDDEAFLFQALRTGWWYEEAAETDKNGCSYYIFGQINVLDVENKTFWKHSIRVYPADDWIEEVTDEGPFRLCETVPGGALGVRMPWGKETLALPLQDPIVFRRE